MSAGDVRAFLERHALAARRGLGQNFLCDEGIAAELVDLAGVAPGDSVVEIGTGLGILTRALAARAARVVTLEIDAGLVRALRADGALPANVELVHADALRADLSALVAGCAAPVRLVGNLPYVISGPLLRRLLDLRERLVDWSVMLQREVADRLLAAPGTRRYGSLAVLHRLAVDMRRLRALAPGCFYPEPKVRSVFLRLVPRAGSPLGEAELPWVERVVRGAFGQRRKTLANALRGADLGSEVSPERIAGALAALDIGPRARAEALAPEQLLALARALAPAGGAP